MSSPSSNEAKKHLDAYLDQVDQLLVALPAGERADIRQEIRSHIDEAVASATSGGDAERLQQAIERLGNPLVYVPALAEEIRLDRKASRGHPAAIFAAFSARLGRGLLDTLLITGLGLAYLFSLGLICLAVFSVFEPDAGLWLNHGGGWTLSFEQQSNADQAFSGTFWLVGGLAGLTLYAGLTGVLRWWLRRSAKTTLGYQGRV